MISYVIVWIIATIISAGLIYFLYRSLVRYNILDIPSEHRWHSMPKPKFGGVGIFIATSLVISGWVIYQRAWNEYPWGLLGGVLLLFLLGVYDDIKPVTPVTKLVVQILAVSIVVFQGYTTYFFTPRLGDSVLAQLPNTILTFVWLIAITNAINLLDNMDGLAGGISLITTIFLSYLFWKDGDWVLLSISVALGGALMGFLIWNFPPARIFMGDSGSQFIGFTLALLAIARNPQASNVFAVIGVPSLLFLLPILDTSFVAVTRVLRGTSPTQGGRDHTSHRLIAFGLSERQVLLVLYSVAVGCGITAIVLESLDYDLSLVLIPFIVLIVFVFTGYLAGVKISSPNERNQASPVSKWVIETAIRRNLLDVAFDFVLMAFVYYLVFFTRKFSLDTEGLREYIQTLPLVYFCGYIAFNVTGIYRELWHYIGTGSIYTYGTASILSSILFGLLSRILSIEVKLSSIFLLGIFLFLGLVVTRFSFRALDQLSVKSRITEAERVLLYGRNDEVEFALLWILRRPEMKVFPVGILVEEEALIGKRISAIPILGVISDVRRICDEYLIDGIFVVESGEERNEECDRLLEFAKNWSGWIKYFRIDIIDFQKEREQKC